MTTGGRTTIGFGEARRRIAEEQDFVSSLIEERNAVPNAQLQFEGGNLPSLTTRDVDVTLNNGFVNKSSDVALKLSIVKGTGVFKGAFTHADGTKTAYQGIVLQEGDDAKGFGFFLSTPTLSYDGAGVSGGVTLTPKE